MADEAEPGLTEEQGVTAITHAAAMLVAALWHERSSAHVVNAWNALRIALLHEGVHVESFIPDQAGAPPKEGPLRILRRIRDATESQALAHVYSSAYVGHASGGGEAGPARTKATAAMIHFARMLEMPLNANADEDGASG